jgi:hypothetical protein
MGRTAAGRDEIAGIFFLLVCAGAVYAGSDAIDAFGLHWRVPIAADWKIEDAAGGPVLHLLVPRPSLAPRRPTQFALAETPDFLRVTVEAEMKKEPAAARNRHTSLMIAYAYRDADHFNYAHLSVDSGQEAAQHNGIFHVDGGDRVRISPREGPGAFDQEKWYQVKLVYDGRTGEVQVWVDGKTSPSLHATDTTLRAGKVGIGSFFDLGSFRHVKIQGTP